MRVRFNRLLFAILVGTTIAAAADLPPMGPPIKLFDGKNLNHFDIYVRDRPLNEDPNKVFQIQDGVVRASGVEYGYIITKEEYGDYYLRMEFKWGEATHEPRKDKARDSGILYHVHGENKIWPSSIEYQFIEGGTGDILVVNGPSLTVKGERKSKGRFDRFGKGTWKDVAGYRDPNGDPEKPRGKWNVVEMISDGDHVKYWLNGKVVNEGTESTVTKGKLLFQSEGAEVFFRKIELRPLKK
ncbi:MAG: DUF1080 domain-containing protein [Acidobacteria bacterium]|nr:DUF1080 domain-containing protein [Acidobacteriota bacterium]